MTYTIETAKAAITGKAKTEIALKEQVNALNFLRGTIPEKEMDSYVRDVDKAAADLSETWHSERVAELLDMGNGAAMWKEFLAHRTCKRVRVTPSKKTNRFEYKQDDKGRVNYPELNDAYIQAETSRIEKEGEAAEVDLDTLTIANDSRFNTYAPLFFQDAYSYFIAHNLITYKPTTAKGAPIECKAPSMRQLMKDFNELIHLLLPDDVAPPMRKNELRTLSVAISGATQTELKRKGLSFCLNWLLNVIQERIEDRPVNVIMDANSLDDVREREFKEDAKTPADDNADNTEDVTASEEREYLPREIAI